MAAMGSDAVCWQMQQSRERRLAPTHSSSSNCVHSHSRSELLIPLGLSAAPPRGRCPKRTECGTSSTTSQTPQTPQREKQTKTPQLVVVCCHQKSKISLDYCSNRVDNQCWTVVAQPTLDSNYPLKPLTRIRIDNR